MKLPIRLENALTKLYTAFHSGMLDAMNCNHCAVGNLCDNSDKWAGVSWFGGENRISKEFNNKTGYSRQELATIELVFIEGNKNPEEPAKFNNSISEIDVIDGRNTKEEQKELQFIGLCAVVEYLCELDNIPNVMDYTKLFETENNQPKYQL